MEKTIPKYARILGVAPSSRGLGFAVLEGLNTLVDWGVKSAMEDKNDSSVRKLEEMLAHYQPDLMVVENTSITPIRRSERIRALTKRIVHSAKSRRVAVRSFSREEVMRTFFADGRGTKYAAAEIIAKRFPEELAGRLPPKRRPWMSEDYRMDIFDAVALCLAYRVKRTSEGYS
jgi:Holliday junction resolvasome RuvABC endonuclease subunit